ncbi:MAG: hypothetical protein P0S95_01220 [Rhabdochlamydiaceae bacterium]|nr:hypothetical protein [Candidatus Amphrikana amoebophyrae]
MTRAENGHTLDAFRFGGMPGLADYITKLPAESSTSGKDPLKSERDFHKQSETVAATILKPDANAEELPTFSHVHHRADLPRPEDHLQGNLAKPKNGRASTKKGSALKSTPTALAGGFDPVAMRARLDQDELEKSDEEIAASLDASRAAVDKATKTDPSTLDSKTEIELLLYILSVAEKDKSDSTESLLKVRKCVTKRMDAVDKVHKENLDAIQGAEESASSASFWLDVGTCFLSSLQIVGGGLALNMPGFQTAGYSMVASGATGVMAQVFKSLGYNPTVTGAISAVSSAIGIMTGTGGFAALQAGSRADTILKLGSIAQTVYSVPFTLKQAYEERKVSVIKSRQVLVDAQQEKNAQKLNDHTKATLEHQAKKDAATVESVMTYLREKQRVNDTLVGHQRG